MGWKFVNPSDYEDMDILLDVEISIREKHFLLNMVFFGYGFIFTIAL